jgi:hypothetical protein
MILASLCLCASAALGQEAPVNYQEQVLPLLQTHCLGCHNSDKRKGDLDLSTYSAAMAGGGSGELAAPGDSANSTLWKAVAHLADPHMPPKKPKLADAELAVFRKWIDGGLVEAKGGAAKKGAKPKVDLALGAVAKGKPEGPPPMPHDLLLEPQLRTVRTESITALAASPWAPLVAVSGQHQVLLYNTDTLDLAGLLPFPERRVHALRFSRNGALLLAAGGRGAKTGAVVVWDVKSGDRLFEIGGEYDLVLAADISPDHSQVALGGPGKLVKIWSTKDGELHHSIKKHTDWVTALEFSPDGVLLATGDRNGGLHVWEAKSGNIFHSLNGHKAAITGLSWRADSNILASSGEDGQVMLWEMQNGSRVKAWQAHPAVESIHCAMDGRLVTCGRDLLTRTWTVDGTKQRDFEAFGDVALRAVFTHDGSKVIAGDWTGDVRAWSAADGKRLGTLSVNPPALAERIAADSKALTDAQAALAPAVEKQMVAQAASDQAAAALKAAEASQADVDKAIVAATQAATAAQAEVAARQAESTQKAETSKGASLALQKSADDLRKLQETNASLLKEIETDPAKAKTLETSQKSASEKATEVAQLSEAAQKSKGAAEQAAGAMGPAQKALAERQATLKQLGEKKTAGATALAELQKQNAAAAPTAVAAKQAADAVAAQVAGLERRLATWKAGQFNVKVHAKKTEAAKTLAELDGLLADVEHAKTVAVSAKAHHEASVKAAAEAVERVNKLDASLGEAKAGPAKAQAALDGAKKSLAEKDARASATQPFAARLAEAAKADPLDVVLGQAAIKAKEATDLLAKDVADANSLVLARAAEIEKAKAAIPEAEKALADGKIASEQAAQKAAVLLKTAAAAQDRIAAEQARADAFKPKVDAAKAEVEQLRAEYAKLAPRN